MVLSWSIGQISQVFITSREFLILPPTPTSSLQSQRSFITFLVKTYSSVVTARTVSPPPQRPECKLWVVKYKNTHNILKLNRPRLTRLSKKKNKTYFLWHIVEMEPEPELLSEKTDSTHSLGTGQTTKGPYMHIPSTKRKMDLLIKSQVSYQ